jgi:hypothetical protein
MPHTPAQELARKRLDEAVLLCISSGVGLTTIRELVALTLKRDRDAKATPLNVRATPVMTP